METNTPKQEQPEESFDWESRLEKLRQTRQINAPYTHAPLIKESAREKPVETETYKLDAGTRDKELMEYLEQWQREHNAELEETEQVETDTMVLLQENWLSAQSSLQMKASDKQIDSTRTVWLNPKHQKVEFAAPEQGDRPSSGGQQEGAAAESKVSDGLAAEVGPRIAVNINVLNPQAVNRKEVFCLSEKDLTERLIERMRPHVADAVNGMIRVAVQKQMALFTYQLQQTLNEQAPQLVEEVLEYNIKKVLTDLKYEMKYKR